MCSRICNLCIKSRCFGCQPDTFIIPYPLSLIPQSLFAPPPPQATCCLSTSAASKPSRFLSVTCHKQPSKGKLTVCWNSIGTITQEPILQRCHTLPGWDGGGWAGMGWDGMVWEEGVRVGGVIRAERPLQHCLYSSTLFSPPLIPSSPYNNIHFYCPSVPYQYVSIIKNVFLFFICVFLGTCGVQKDSLVELSFHIPPTNHQFVGDEDKPSAIVFKDKILDRADVGPTDDTSVVDFGGCQLLTPRWDGWDGLGRMGRRWGWEGDGGAGGILRHCCSG